MIFGMLNFEKIPHEMLQICPPHVSDVDTLSWEILKKSHFQQYYSYIILIKRRKQTVLHLPTPPENVTTLTCEVQNFFI